MNWKIDEFESEVGIFQDISGPGALISPGMKWAIRCTIKIDGVNHGVFGMGIIREEALSNAKIKMTDFEQERASSHAMNNR